MVIALALDRQLTLSNFLLLFFLMLIFNIRQKYTSSMNPFLTFLMVFYVSLNFWVNLFDLFWNYLLQNITYRQDDDFVHSFSYKIH